MVKERVHSFAEDISFVPLHLTEAQRRENMKGRMNSDGVGFQGD